MSKCFDFMLVIFINSSVCQRRGNSMIKKTKTGVNVDINSGRLTQTDRIN